MKLFEVAAKYKKLYHRMSTENFEKLQSSGEFALKRGTLCTTHDKNANEDKDFGEILLELNVAKIVARGAKIVDMVYTLDWLEQNNLIKHVTGMTKQEWLTYAKMQGASDEEEADFELQEAYADEKEVVIYIDKILSSEVKRLK